MEDPIELLVYELMRRGSVLPGTMIQVVQKIRDGEVQLQDDAMSGIAVGICRQLPWYKGA